ncbi:MAG: Ig-like domain-containing protein [Longimicrobiales bacterium]
MNWLTCVDCTNNERSFVVDSLGRTIIPLLDQVLQGIDSIYGPNMHYNFRSEWMELSTAAVDSGPYLDRFNTNFKNLVQRRAAIALGDLGASKILQTALNESVARGYRADLIRVIRRSLDVAQGLPGIPGVPADVNPIPDAVTIAVGDSAVIKAIVMDSSGALLPNETLVWSSSLIAVATVAPRPRQRGWVVGVAVGTATVRATSTNNVLGATVVTVVPAQTIYRMSIAGGNAQTDTIDQVLPDSLRVSVTDTGGNPVSGVAVNWNVRYGGGVFESTGTAETTTLTGATGIARVRFRLGPTAGLAAISAVAGSTSIRFRQRAINP